MSKKDKHNAVKSKATNNNNEQPKKVIHNRLRPDRSNKNNPKSEKQQNYYYENQAKLLLQKKEYRRAVKAGEIIPKKKDGKSGRTYVKKYETDEQRHQAKLQSNRNWYNNNKKRILDQQSEYNEKKVAEAREKRKQDVLDDWEKFNQDIGNR